MDYKFYFGYHNRFYTSTSVGGIPTSHTNVEQAEDITWFERGLEFSTFTVENDSNLVSLGTSLTTEINNLIAPNSSKFDYEFPYPYAFQLESNNQVYFTLYDYDEKEKIFTLHETTNSTLRAGSYGILCSRVKTPSLGITYKPGVDATGEYKPLHTENIVLDYNQQTAAFSFNTPDNHYVARTSLEVLDPTHTLASLTNSLPLAPNYFYLNYFGKSEHVLDYFIDDVSETTPAVNDIWGPRVFFLIAVLTASATTGKIGLVCTCYENNKAPTKLTINYKNAASGYDMGTNKIGPIYEVLNPNLLNHSKPNEVTGLQWDDSIRDLVPADSTFEIDTAKTATNFDNPTWSEGAVSYTGICNLYPSKYIISTKDYIETTLVAEQNVTISLTSGITYGSLFNDYRDHTIQEPTDENTVEDIPIKVRLATIDRNSTVVKRDDLILFDDICTGFLVVVTGRYNRYFTCTIKYHGNNIFSPTNAPTNYTYDGDGSINGPDNQSVLPIDFHLSECDQPLICDTKDLNNSLASALGLIITDNILNTNDGQPIVKSITKQVYTNNVDATLAFNVDSPTPATFFSAIEVDTWFKTGTRSSFSNFKENPDSAVLNKTLQNFLDTSSDLIIHVYGDFFSAKKVKFNTVLKPNSIEVRYVLFQPKASSSMSGVNSPMTWESVVLYYGREFTYLELMEHIFNKNNFQFTLLLNAEPLTNYVIDDVYDLSNLSSPISKTAKINYTTQPRYQQYYVKYLKRIDTVHIDLSNAVHTVTSKKFAQDYLDHTWEPTNGITQFDLPKDLVASTISNFITGGKLILIASENHLATNVYSDITLKDGCFPTVTLHNDFTKGEGVKERTATRTLQFNQALDFSGIMGLSCTAYDTGHSYETTKKIYDLLNNEHTRAHTGKAAERSRFVIAAVGAGAGGTSGDPGYMWVQYGGGGGGSGGYGIWYVDLIAMGKAYGVDWKEFKLKYSGGVGGSTPSDENTQGGNGSSLFLNIIHDQIQNAVIQIEVYGGGKARWTEGGAGGAKPKVIGQNDVYFIEIKADAGVGGRRGESGMWTVREDETDYKLPDSLNIKTNTDYDPFFRNQNNFLGIYLDEAKFGTYITDLSDITQYTLRAYHSGYATKHMESNYKDLQTRLKNILANEQSLKNDVYNNPYGLNLYALFGGNYYYQRLITDSSDYSLGGTGAPSICGFPTYWLKVKSNVSDRIAGSVISGDDLTRYNSKPCYGAGGCGGSATYITFGENADKCNSKGRQGGDSYWAIFC